MKDLIFTIDRTYYPGQGTNGDITLMGILICHCIELPWLENKRKFSCVPEGIYEAERYQSPKHGAVLLLLDVPNRSMVEVHEANWALGADGKHPQLEGCIAPVTTLDKPTPTAKGTPGVGWRSGDACNKVEGIAFPHLAQGGKVFFNIKKK